MSYWNKVYINQDVYINDVFEKLSDEHLITELQDRGYIVHKDDTEVILTKEQEKQVLHQDYVNIELDIHTDDVLDEMNSDDIVEYCQFHHITVADEDDIVDELSPEYLGYMMSKLGPYEISQIFNSFRYNKRVYMAKKELKEYLLECIDNWINN